MKKVALITFHLSLNYGANLQTYATSRVLRDMGYDVELIDIRIEEKSSWLQNLLLYPKKLSFAGFRTKFYPPLTRHYKSVEDLRSAPPHADIFMVGSDQTWNYKITRDIEDAFLLDFGPAQTQRIGYSVSFGDDDWRPRDNTHLERIRKCTSVFFRISAREMGGVEIFRDLLGRNVPNTLDPTLLNDKYPEITGAINPKHNIVSYKLVSDDGYYSLLNKIGIELGRDVRLLGKLKPEKNFRYEYPQNIREWIRAIAQSDLVITDSFHGVAFSILYERNFLVFPGNPNRMGRINTLLGNLGLTDRLWEGEYKEEEILQLCNKPVNYPIVTSRLRKLRAESLDFLRMALNDAP